MPVRIGAWILSTPERGSAERMCVEAMDELVRQVAQKVGISEDQARVAVEMVVNFLKAKLPAPLAAHVDTALGAAAPALANLDVGSIASSIGGLFGRK